MNRISRLEQEQDAQNAKKKNEITAYQPELKGMMNGLRSLDDKMADLVERIEEAEERLFEAEGLGVEVDGRLNDLEVKSEELEEELEALKDDFDDFDDFDGVHRAKQEENHTPKPKESESRVHILNKEEPPSTSKSIKAESPEMANRDDNSTNTTTTITTVILAQSPFLKAFSLKRRLSESNLLEDRQLHPTERSRKLSNELSS